LEGFKNFRDATLQLGPLTVIVGTNASGKSNIRDAFRFLHGMGRGYSLAEIIGEKYVEGAELVWKGIRGGIRDIGFNGSNRFDLKTEADLKVADGPTTKVSVVSSVRHQIKVGVNGGAYGPKVITESLSYGDSGFHTTPAGIQIPGRDGLSAIFNSDVKRGFGYNANKPILPQVASEIGFGSLVSHADIPINVRKRAGEYVQCLASMRFLDIFPDAAKNPSFPGQIVLGDRGENLSSVLLAICEDKNAKRSVIEWVRQLTPLDVVDFEFVPDQTGRVLMTLIESSGRRTSAYSASDGTLRFLAIIAALMGPDAAKFYFLEEIDNGIHPTRLALLLQLIEQQTKLRGIQVVCTTHSPQLLAMLSDESRQHASLVYRLEGATDAKIIRIVDIPGAKEVLETNNLARLHESGWLEDAVSFANTTETP